ncbi:mechanosensitive ion channel family protein [Vibrio mediterranei]|uniref:mechanosensitive ion channel family protein n=1 Tax=Vibrio mediterranei TaxID=689 RepID=UPI004067B9C3
MANEILTPVLTAVVYLICWYLLHKKITAFLKNTERANLRLAFKALKAPIFIAVSIVPLTPFIEMAFKHYGMMDHFPRAVAVYFLTLVTWFISNIISLVETRLSNSNRDDMDLTLVSALSKLAKFVLFSCFILVLLSKIGVKLEALLAFSGISGLIVGLAFKDIASNLMAAAVLYIEQHIAVGDWVEVPAVEVSGTVIDIGWRVTTLLTFDKRPLYLPNSLFITNVIVNPSRMHNRRILERFKIELSQPDLIEDALIRVRRFLEENPSVDTTEKQTTLVAVDNIEPDGSGATVLIYCFTYTISFTRYHEIKQDVILGVLRELQACGLSIATNKIQMVDQKKILTNME